MRLWACKRQDTKAKEAFLHTSIPLAAYWAAKVEVKQRLRAPAGRMPGMSPSGDSKLRMASASFSGSRWELSRVLGSTLQGSGSRHPCLMPCNGTQVAPKQETAYTRHHI